MAVIFDDLSDELCRVADMAEFVRLAHPDQQVAFAAQEACINISGLVEQLNTHTGIYEKLKEAVETGDINPESSVDKHVGKVGNDIYLVETRRDTITSSAVPARFSSVGNPSAG